MPEHLPRVIIIGHQQSTGPAMQFRLPVMSRQPSRWLACEFVRINLMMQEKKGKEKGGATMLDLDQVKMKAMRLSDSAQLSVLTSCYGRTRYLRRGDETGLVQCTWH
jgi:hypothetical protein